MATRPLPITAAPSGSLSKYLLFGFIGLMMLYVLRHNEGFVFSSTDPAWEHYNIIKWYLLPHGVAGAAALLLGPMQFSERLRKRFKQLHRISGRVYVIAVCIAAPMGAYLQYREETLFGTSRSFTVATIVDGTLWLTTTLIAFAFIRAGRIQQHRQWMTRSFAVAIAFLEIRVIGGLTGWDTSIANVEAIVWACVAFALLGADIVLQLQEMKKMKVART